MPKFAAIIPAAGSSTRFGGLVKKPFLPLDGKPIWQRTLDLFAKHPDCVKALLVISPDDLDEFRQKHAGLLMLAYDNVQIVAGGSERFESVANALAHVPKSADLVAVHDAVRCLTTPTLIQAVLDAAHTHGGAMAAIPVADTLKRVEPSTKLIEATVPRANLWQAQTPQIFHRIRLLNAYARRGELKVAITDDAQLMESLGEPVVVVPGSPMNFKITTPDDFRLAELMLQPLIEKPKARRPFDDE
ncbi:MAG: 2-C-methyl-D-erythritol 4-phosphate cytidylyltransferase [Fimbriiglobus sp.]